MDNIKEAIKHVYECKKHMNTLDEFAREKYDERFANLKKEFGTFHGYKDYKVLSENKLEIRYIYGYSDIEYDDFFIVEIE